MSEDTAANKTSPSVLPTPDGGEEKQDQERVSSSPNHVALERLIFEEFRRLDPGAVLLWKIEALLAFGWIIVAGFVGGVLLWRLGSVPVAVIFSGWGVLVGLVWFAAWWFPPRRYEVWRYRLDAQVLELRFGVFWQTSVMIPLSRLQHIDLHHGPLERRYGLATLSIHTAGTEHAKHQIPHLASEIAERLRQRLIDKTGNRLV